MSVLRAKLKMGTSLVPVHALPPGTVYTYGERVVHYMRIEGGSVVIASRSLNNKIGRWIVPAINGGHFDLEVEVCDAEITITNP